MKLINSLDKTLKILSICALLVMVFLVFFNALLRYAFDSGIAWSEEFARVCFVYMIFFGIILVAKEKSHLTVDILISYLPETYKKIFRVIANILILVATLLLAYGAYQLMLLTYDQKMPATGITSSVLYLAAIIASITYFSITLFELYLDITKK